MHFILSFLYQPVEVRALPQAAHVAFSALQFAFVVFHLYVSLWNEEFQSSV